MMSREASSVTLPLKPVIAPVDTRVQVVSGSDVLVAVKLAAAVVIWTVIVSSAGRPEGALIGGSPGCAPGVKTVSLTMMFCGSISNSPLAPAVARRSTVPKTSSAPWPEISTKPPLPPAGPPRAESAPYISVRSSELMTSMPPSPAPVASARISAPRSTTVVRAMVWLRPRPVVPTSTVPPPAPPEASMRAVPPTVTRPLPCSAMDPPRWSAPPVAEIAPSTRTPPPSARSATWPVCVPTVGASMRPVWRIRSSTRPEAACAVSSTDPPGASITPLFVTSAWPPSGAVRTACVTSMLISPSPARSRTKVSAAPSATRPRRARMMPELDTPGATSAASPRSATVMVPWFSTRAPGRGAWSKTIRPAMKFSFVMPAAEAIRLATFTCAPCAKTTPDWFTMATPPLACTRPAMTDGSGVVTRFSVQEPWPGCTNWTVCWLPTLNCCQSIAARFVPCVMVVVPVPRVMAAWPATTCPPVGPVAGATVCAATGPAAMGSSAVVASSQPRWGVRRRGALAGAGTGRGAALPRPGFAKRAMAQNLTRVRK